MLSFQELMRLSVFIGDHAPAGTAAVDCGATRDPNRAEATLMGKFKTGSGKIIVHATETEDGFCVDVNETDWKKGVSRQEDLHAAIDEAMAYVKSQLAGTEA